MNDKSEDITELAKALCKVQSEDLFALTDKENPFFKSKYADLSSCWTVARKPLTENGLSVAQLMESTEDGTPVVVTMLMHISGQWIKSSLVIKPDKPGPQALGSAITYGRRYAFCAIVGICPEDDDADSATKRKKAGESGKKPEKKTPKKEEEPQGKTSNFKFLETMKGLKDRIVKVDGNADMYYKKLGNEGFEKSNLITVKADHTKIYKILKTYVEEQEIADAG